MRRRILHVRLPHPSLDRLASAHPEFRSRPLAVAADMRGKPFILARNPEAARAGIRPGQLLANARAIQPDLIATRLDPSADACFLEDLARRCRRFTPWAGLDRLAPPGSGGLLLDVTGCCHLFGGEAGLLQAAADSFVGGRLTARLALADTPGAAWAWSLAGDSGTPILAPGAQEHALRPLPVHALRVPAATVAQLERLGLATIGALADIPRASIAARFGSPILERLDQAMGRRPEPIEVLPWLPPVAAQLDFVPALATADGVQASLGILLMRLANRLRNERLGARRLRLSLLRIDGSRERVEIGTSRPSRDPAHLGSLFAPRMEQVDPRLGIERMRLHAAETEPYDGEALAFPEHGALHPGGPGQDCSGLIDRLANRLGRGSVAWAMLRPAHSPREQVLRIPAADSPEGIPATEDWPDAPERPLRLFPRPEPLEPGEAGSAASAGPPRSFAWRGRLWRLAHAGEAERIAAPWWRKTAERSCDRFRVEDSAGRRLWLARDAEDGQWRVEGLFG